MSFKKHRDYKLGTLLIRRDRYLDATDKFKHLLDIFPNALPDILIFLYQQLKEKYFTYRYKILKIYFPVLRHWIFHQLVPLKNKLLV